MASKGSRVVGVVNFNRAIEKLLLEYGEEVNKVLDKSVETVAEAAADKLRGHRKFNPSRRPTGKYADSWKAEKFAKGLLDLLLILIGMVFVYFGSR